MGWEPWVGHWPDNGRRIVAVGASAGGVEALQQMVSSLPADLAAAVFVVLHFPARGESALPRILERAGPLPASHARDGERVEAGRIYVAPPDRHLLVERGSTKLVRGPRENNHRPAIDPLFRSAALTYGSQAVGVILSGTLDDGAAGLRAVTVAGGVGIVQDPGEAPYGDMPRNAIRADEPQYVLPLGEIGPALARLTSEERPAAEEDMDETESEVRYAELDLNTVQQAAVPGAVVPLSCPDCGGTLWELEEGERVRFRCRVGHAFGPDSMDEAQEKALETALWAALRALEERAALSRRLAGRMEDEALARQRLRFEGAARQAEQDSGAIREVLLGLRPRQPEEAAS